MNELLIIFLAQIVYVSLVTVRWIILVRGARILASLLSFFEILVYAYALTLVVGKLTEPSRLIVYAGGYAVGCYVGTWLEAKLAYGTAAIQCVAPSRSELSEKLRSLGYLSIEWSGAGRDSDRRCLLFVVRRRQLPNLVKLVEQLEPTAMLVELEPRSLKNVNLSKTA